MEQLFTYQKDLHLQDSSARAHAKDFLRNISTLDTRGKNLFAFPKRQPANDKRTRYFQTPSVELVNSELAPSRSALSSL